MYENPGGGATLSCPPLPTPMCHAKDFKMVSAVSLALTLSF